MREPITVEVDAILPQAGRMRLLSRAIEGDETSIVVEAAITPDNPFWYGDGVGGWVGIEYMAQAVAAWAGWRAQLRGEPPKVGFLLGSRTYQCTREIFYSGEILRIEALQLVWGENGLGQFDCRIEIDGAEVARAALTVFEPADSTAFIQESA